MRILITGAAGSGTTTLAAALAHHLQAAHLELDDYFWLPTSPPYRQPRPGGERLSACLRDLHAAPSAVVSGSLMGWGEDLENAFDLVVFLYLRTEIRLERLYKREIARRGRVDLHFLKWAAQYDDGPPEGRSLAKHLSWLRARTCPVLRIEEDLTVHERMRKVLEAMSPDRHDAKAMSHKPEAAP